MRNEIADHHPFCDIQVSGVVQRGGGSGSWLGPLESVLSAGHTMSTPRTGDFILSVFNDSWMSNIRFHDTPHLQYEIRPFAESSASGQLFNLCLVDISVRYSMPEDLDEAEMGRSLYVRGNSLSQLRSSPARRRRLPSSVAHTPDNDDILDVGVRWTPQAAAFGGGAAAMMNLVNTAIDESNTILKNSGVSLRLRLTTANVIEDTSYTEPTVDAFVTLFWAFFNQNDGTFDVDTGQRYAEGSDVMILLVNDAGFCGAAGQLSSSNLGGSDAFGVVARVCATGSFTFLHEIGHTLGLHHDGTSGW